MEVRQEQFPKIAAPEVKNDPNAAHNQTVAHKIASAFPKVHAEIGKSIDPNEIRVIPLRPGPLPPEYSKFPKFLWHPSNEAMVVNSEEELETALADGYLTERPDTIDKDAIRAKIKALKAEIKRLEADMETK